MANKASPNVGLHICVPLGSVLGLKNYCMYTKIVGEMIKQHNFKYHCYTDDTQAYITLNPCDKGDDISSSIETLNT